MPERAANLRRARIATGLTSASAAAKRLGIKVSTYLAHENGTRAFSVSDATVYAKRFGVSLEWLLTGSGDPDQKTRESPVRGTPIIGSLSYTAWDERPPLDLNNAFNDFLEIAVLAGGPDARWFAVLCTEKFPGSPGDHLICRAVEATSPNGGVYVCEREGFAGKLRQLVPAQCVPNNGSWDLVLRSGNPEINGRPAGPDVRVLGQIESLYRSL